MIKMIQKKKGQMEILGLAIVVILLTLGVLFFIRFALSEKPSELKQSYEQTEMASNMINTMLRLDTECRGKSMTELMQSCASTIEINCGNGVMACEYLDNVVDEIMANTLESWGLEYQFSVWIEDGEYLVDKISSAEACQGEKESKSFFIPLQTTTISLKLDLCN